MAYGPGKYDDLCSFVRGQAEAMCAIVAIIDGNKGNGFSVQSMCRMDDKLPRILRKMADDIEATVRAEQQ